MPYHVIASPVGDLTLFEEEGALIALEWGSAPPGEDPTPLLLDAERQLTAYFEGKLQSFSLPLRPSGTPFQNKVFAAMQRIPFGKTRSYADIASEIGSAPRAVGSACGRNPLPIVIPCHRVVGKNGHLGGFSGGDGLPTKKILLALESGEEI